MSREVKISTIPTELLIIKYEFKIAERNLGELIKKGLMTLQKNQRIFEPIKGEFTSIFQPSFQSLIKFQDPLSALKTASPKSKPS
jgi:hypothetical protein